MIESELASLIERFDNHRIGVVGDVMLDRYLWGNATRISQEAPVPVVHVRNESATPGGAANVVRNVVALGGRGMLFGVVGRDRYADVLRERLARCGADIGGLVEDPDRGTTVKTRVIAGSQQVVRIDREHTLPIGLACRETLLDKLTRAVKSGLLEAVILEDYAKGLFDQAFMAEIVELCRHHGVSVSLDPHSANAFQTRGLRLITPNRAEAFALAGAYYRPGVMPLNEDIPLLDVGEKLLRQWQSESLLVTLGGHGMALFEAGSPPLHIPTRAREVFDVSGAGDTVMATFVLALLAGACTAEAAHLANHAAGVVVAEVGTAAVSRAELLATLQSSPREDVDPTETVGGNA